MSIDSGMEQLAGVSEPEHLPVVVSALAEHLADQGLSLTFVGRAPGPYQAVVMHMFEFEDLTRESNTADLSHADFHNDVRKASGATPLETVQKSIELYKRVAGLTVGEA